jgi:hypothetical protein
VNLVGVLALLFWAIHAANHVFIRHTAYDLLWTCNVATALLALGAFLRNARLCAIALCWLAYGTPIWLLDLATGAGMIPTSPLTHFGGLALAVIAVRKLGFPRWSWAWAVGASLVLVVLARILTSAQHNVMLAHRVHDGWEKYFSSHPTYFVVMMAGSAVVFFVVETLARRFEYRPR